MNWTHFSRLLDWKRFRTWWIADCKWTEGNSWQCTEFGFSANIANLFWPTLAPDRMGAPWLFNRIFTTGVLLMLDSARNQTNLSLGPRKKLLLSRFKQSRFLFVKPFFLLWDLKKSFLPFYSILITEVFMEIEDFKGIKKLFPRASIMYDKVPFDSMFH